MLRDKTWLLTLSLTFPFPLLKNGSRALVDNLAMCNFWPQLSQLRRCPSASTRCHSVTVDAKQPTSAKHDQDRHSLVRYQPTAASDTADTNKGRLRLRYDSQISAGPRHLPGRGRLHDYTCHQVSIKLFRSLAPDPCYAAISHKTSLAIADRLFGHVTTGLW